MADQPTVTWSTQLNAAIPSLITAAVVGGFVMMWRQVVIAEKQQQQLEQMNKTLVQVCEQLAKKTEKDADQDIKIHGLRTDVNSLLKHSDN